MLHSDVFDGVQPLLREIFAEARRESVEAAEAEGCGGAGRSLLAGGACEAGRRMRNGNSIWSKS